MNKDIHSALQFLQKKFMAIMLSKKKLFPCYKVAFEKWEKTRKITGSSDGNPLTFELRITDTDTAVNI